MQPQWESSQRDARYDAESVRARLRSMAGIAVPPKAIARKPAHTGDFRIIARPLWIVAAIGLVGVLRVGREVLVPLMLAVLLALALSGIVEGLRRWRIPRAVSALVLVVAGTFALGCAVDALC